MLTNTERVHVLDEFFGRQYATGVCYRVDATGVCYRVYAIENIDLPVHLLHKQRAGTFTIYAREGSYY